LIFGNVWTYCGCTRVRTASRTQSKLHTQAIVRG
jgi:hypothetical protein